MYVLAEITTQSLNKCLDVLPLKGCREKYVKLLKFVEGRGGKFYFLGNFVISEEKKVPFFKISDGYRDVFTDIPEMIRACAIELVYTPGGWWERPQPKHWE